MNQGKLEVVKQEMARVNVSVLRISELTWTGMGEFNSDDHHVYYCGQEPLQFNSVQSSVVSNSLRPHELQHARPPCPSPTARVHTNPCPLGRGCHSTISSSIVPFSSRPQSFPASRSFQTSQFFALGGHSIGVSASTSVLPMNTQD